MRLMLKVQSDPEGIWDTEVQNFTGFAAQAKEMSEQQRAEATVSYDTVPTELLERFAKTGKAYGIEKLDRATVEELAGAYAMKDGERIDRILRKARK